MLYNIAFLVILLMQLNFSRSALASARALIGERVISCWWAIDFYLHSYLLMDLTAVAWYRSRRGAAGAHGC